MTNFWLSKQAIIKAYEMIADKPDNHILQIEGWSTDECGKTYTHTKMQVLDKGANPVGLPQETKVLYTY